MRVFSCSLILLFSMLLFSSKSFCQNALPPMGGPYLGQKPPGLTPKVFAPGYVATRHRDFSGSFTPDMKEFYFSRKDVDTNKWWLIRFKLLNGQWEESLMGPRIGRPILAPDGNTMHLGNKYMNRTTSGWSSVKSLGPMFDRKDWGIMRLSASRKGTYVFDDYKNKDVIRISSVKDGQRQPPILMGPQINSGKWTAHPFIAPNESFLIWDSEKEDGYGDKDLYISFRQRDGKWGAAKNLGAHVNTANGETNGYVSPDGKYLFFNRNINQTEECQGTEGDIYWVDAVVIESLRPSSPNKE